jgi:hypothetical protein
MSLPHKFGIVLFDGVRKSLEPLASPSPTYAYIESKLGVKIVASSRDLKLDFASRSDAAAWCNRIARTFLDRGVILYHTGLGTAGSHSQRDEMNGGDNQQCPGCSSQQCVGCCGQFDEDSEFRYANIYTNIYTDIYTNISLTYTLTSTDATRRSTTSSSTYGRVS